VVRPDDCRLDPDELKAVEKRARLLLNRASAWDRFPTPIEDLLAAANLKVAPSSIFNAGQLIAYLQHKAVEVKNRIKTALSKILGVYDSFDSIIHIDDKVVKSKQNFLKLHETGHHEIPSHRKAFSLFQDSETTLSPEIADLFEREANNFARFILFQGDGYSKLAADHNMGIRVPIDLAKKFGASIYASAREYARTNPHPCLVYALEPVEMVPGDGSRALVRRVEASPSFKHQFALPADTEINHNHPLWSVLPIDRRMTSPRHFQIIDRNGTRHECFVEAFKTPFNILILLYPTRELTSKTVVSP